MHSVPGEQDNKEDIKFVRSRQPGIISLMSYSLLWFVKINTELLRGVHLEGALYLFLQTRVTSKT